MNQALVEPQVHTDSPFRRAHLGTATSRRLGLPLRLWRRGAGRGGRHVGKPLLRVSVIVFVPLSPRSAGGEREERPVAVARSARSRGARPRLLALRRGGS